MLAFQPNYGRKDRPHFKILILTRVCLVKITPKCLKQETGAWSLKNQTDQRDHENNLKNLSFINFMQN